MPKPQYEVCQIRAIETKKGGLFSSSHNIFVAEMLAPSENKVIAKTKEFQNKGPTPNKVCHQLIQRLTADGWELVGEVPLGRDILAWEEPLSLRRPITSSQPPSATELLQQLASLKDAGILTQEEFEAKKAEILKRL
jgi:hypothetical protein